MRWTCLRCCPAMTYHSSRKRQAAVTAAADGSIRSGPPPLVTVSEGRAAGSVAIPTDCGPPLAVGGHRVRAAGHGQDGRAAVGADRHRSPGPWRSVTIAEPPPVVMVAVAAVRSWATRAPPPVSARSGPLTPRRTSGPPPVPTVSGPPISVALHRAAAGVQVRPGDAGDGHRAALGRHADGDARTARSRLKLTVQSEFVARRVGQAEAAAGHRLRRPRAAVAPGRT